MLNKRGLWSLLLALSVLLSACMDAEQDLSVIPTNTLAPIVSMTPRFTATPMSTRTPLPTFTLTPSETPIPPTPSDTPTPTEIPPIMGIITSMQTVNVREGPGVSFRAFQALPAGESVEILGQSPEGNWLNIKLSDGREGWVSSTLVRLRDTPTPFPTATATADMTAIALGTVFPTDIFGQTITPTPPGSIVSPTPVTQGDETEAEPQAEATAAGTSFLPVIDVTSIGLTATALTGGGVVAPTLTPPAVTQAAATQETVVGVATLVLTPGAEVAATLPATNDNESGIGSAGSASPQEGVDVLAYCNDPIFRMPAPTNLMEGSTIDIWWSWYAKTEEQLQDHINNMIYEVAIDGVMLRDYTNYQSRIRQERDGNYYVYWYVPAGPLAAGTYEITYRVSWRQRITDGYTDFGPGTARPQETGSCTFTVR